MGRDYELVAYRGAPLREAELARLVRRAAPLGELYRHSRGTAAWSSRKTAPLADLHCVAFYEPRMPDDKAPAVYFVEDAKMVAVQQQAARDDRSLASIVQAAWGLMRTAYVRPASSPPTEPSAGEPSASDPPPMLELARAISRVIGDAFWVLQGDHSCTGGYARFHRGELVDPTSIDDVFVDDDYVGVPTRKWSAALGTPVELDAIVSRYFPDRKQPPLRDVDRPTRPIAFDGRKYDFALD